MADTYPYTNLEHASVPIAAIDACGRWLAWVVTRIFSATLGAFLRGLFFNGPALPFMRMFWQGMEAADMCAALSGLSSQRFRLADGSPTLDCFLLREQKFVEFLYGLGLSIFCAALALIVIEVLQCVRWRFVMGPVLRDACAAVVAPLLKDVRNVLVHHDSQGRVDMALTYNEAEEVAPQERRARSSSRSRRSRACSHKSRQHRPRSHPCLAFDSEASTPSPTSASTSSLLASIPSSTSLSLLVSPPTSTEFINTNEGTPPSLQVQQDSGESAHHHQHRAHSRSRRQRHTQTRFQHDDIDTHERGTLFQGIEGAPMRSVKVQQQPAISILRVSPRSSPRQRSHVIGR